MDEKFCIDYGDQLFCVSESFNDAFHFPFLY